MKMLCSVKLSPHKYKTPEGYLVCKDAIIARTGSQTYLKSELYPNITDDDYIEINRSEKEVFDEKTIASFENKPLTIEHPEEPVNPDNYKYLSVGNTFNVRKGEYEGQPVLLADIMVTDSEAIQLIESGEMTELSCGYDCDITNSPNPEQINIRGNHVALCVAGRAGIARIQDSKKDNKLKTKWIQSINDSSVNKGTLIQEFGKYGKQYKIEKIVGNVIYAKNLIDEKIVLFKKDEENVEWAIITKSDIKDSLKVTYISDNISKLEDELFRALKKFLSKIDEELLDYSGVEIKNIEKNEYEIYVFSELSYKNLMELADILNKIIIKYDENAYFDAEAPGRLKAYCNISDLRAIHKIDTNDVYIEDDIYVIQLDDEVNYLDENNKPTKDINKAKKFTSFEEAEEYKNLYCKGKVIKLNKLKNDEYSKKFYSKIIKELENKLNELNNNEYLDNDNFVLEKQKNNLKTEIKNQIEKYKNKLNEQ